jgi:hypothetical protein
MHQMDRAGVVSGFKYLFIAISNIRQVFTMIYSVHQIWGAISPRCIQIYNVDQK